MLNNKPFTPTDYEELMNPQNHVERVVLNENNVLQIYYTTTIAEKRWKFYFVE